VVASLGHSYRTDPRIKDIFAAADDARLARLLSEQICYITGGPCHYMGRDMKASHADMGVQTADFNALVEDLQKAMDKERVPAWAQNKLLAKLAPMKRVVVTR
jgi:hemoglobin